MVNLQAKGLCKRNEPKELLGKEGQDLNLRDWNNVIE